MFGLLLVLKNKRVPKGILFITYQCSYAFRRFTLEFLRGDTPRYLFNWSTAQSDQY
ncbi:prolipoprotein diacylglyceryl transferase family protein [Brevibacillus choshinensis]|uniref:prolipoprotein diacylglyceryl transferase family protein n=1 Tax=Brevibacillus choshinensis TaxID=54911 RepID=UPI0038B3D314